MYFLLSYTVLDDTPLEEKIKAGPIAGGVVGGIAAVVALVLLSCLVVKRYRRTSCVRKKGKAEKWNDLIKKLEMKNDTKMNI